MSPWSALVWQSSLRCTSSQWAAATATAASTTIATINLKSQVKVWQVRIAATGHYVIQVKETRSNNRRAATTATTTLPTRSHSLPTFLLYFRALLTGLATRSLLLLVLVAVVEVKKGLLSRQPLHCLLPVGHWSPSLLSGTFSPSPLQLPSELSILHFSSVYLPSLDSSLAALSLLWFSAPSARHLILILFYLTFGMVYWLPFALSAHFR